MSNSTNNKYYDKKLLIIFFLPIIIFSKIIRFTIMKSVLVDYGTGRTWISKILYEELHFGVWQSDLSFETRSNAITFFQKINLLNLSTTEHWEIYITILFNILLILILLRVKEKLRLGQFLYLCFSIAILNIFVFCLSKDPVQMLYFVMIFLLLCKGKMSDKKKFILTILIIIFSAMTLRNYYILIATYTLVGYFLCNFLINSNRKVKATNIIAIIIGVGIIFLIMLKVSSNLAPGEYKELIGMRIRYRGNANTQIMNIIKGDGLIIFTINYLINVIRLCFPIELFTKGIKYIPFVLYQLFMSYYLISSIKNIKTNSGSKIISLYLYIGFILASAMFEPDFGSWVRHEAIFFPLVLFLNDSIKEKYTKKKELSKRS